MKNACVFLIALIVILSSCAPRAVSSVNQGFVPPSPELYQEIYLMDSLMFAAFNEQDTEKMMSYFSKDLEFYHDKGGMDDYDATRRKTVALFENNKTSGLNRQLLKETLEVYPIAGYGALEVHLHRFCHQENGKNDCGIFKNIMIWKKEEGHWKVSRVISYDH